MPIQTDFLVDKMLTFLTCPIDQFASISLEFSHALHRGDVYEIAY